MTSSFGLVFALASLYENHHSKYRFHVIQLSKLILLVITLLLCLFVILAPCIVDSLISLIAK